MMSEQLLVQGKVLGAGSMAVRAALGLGLAVGVGASLAYKDEIEQRVMPTIEFSLTDPLVESLIGSEPMEPVDHSINIDTAFPAIEEESQNPLPDNALIQSLIG